MVESAIVSHNLTQNYNAKAIPINDTDFSCHIIAVCVVYRVSVVTECFMIYMYVYVYDCYYLNPQSVVTSITYLESSCLNLIGHI